MRRQRQTETGADGTVARLERAAVRGGDAVRNRQAQPGALPHFLGREERLEDAAPQLRLIPGPSSSDLDDLCRPRLHRPDDDRSAPGRRLDSLLGVEQEVQHDLLDLLAIDQDRQRLGRALHDERDVLLPRW